MQTSKDLTRQPPRSPRQRLGGYVILGRTIDKCRALLWSNIGEYHYDCPLDNVLFGFKGVTGDDLKKEVERGAADDELAHWLDTHGTPKTFAEIKEWGDQVEQWSMVNADDPEKVEYFIAETKKLGLDPHQTSVFTWLEADDKASFK